MDHDELVHVELAPRDDQGAERVVGRSAAGVSDEVGVADRDAKRVLGAAGDVHAGHDREHDSRRRCGALGRALHIPEGFG
jgi:hypothetical protein